MNGAPERLHLVPIEPSGAGQESGRVEEVAGAGPVYPNPEFRILFGQDARHTSVIEVDVGQEDGGNVFKGGSEVHQAAHKGREGAGRAGINQDGAVHAIENAGGDVPRLTLEAEVDRVDAGAGEHGIHWGSG